MGKDSKGSFNESGQYVKTSRDSKYFNGYSSDPSKPNHERLTISRDNKGAFSYSYRTTGTFDELTEYYGFDAETIKGKTLSLVKKVKNKYVESKGNVPKS